MAKINADLIERYQEILRKEAKSKVFAPLAEAYRKMGMIDQALRVSQQGVQYHPNFASGRVALGQALLQKSQFNKALGHFKKAVEISPDNILAHEGLAKSYLKLRKPKEALSSYKMVLFLSPDDQKAQAVVKKLESATAEDYDDELFAMKTINEIFIDEVIEEEPTPPPAGERALLRHISLVDAFIMRNENDRAFEILHQARKKFGANEEIDRRWELLGQQLGEPEFAEAIKPLQPISTEERDDPRKEKLENMLHRVIEWKKEVGPS